MANEFTPSVFTPFTRRFTDERARDLHELRDLYFAVQRMHRASRFSSEEAYIELGRPIYARFHYSHAEPTLVAIAGLLSDITLAETAIFQFPDIKWDIAHLTLKEQVDLNRFLTAKQFFHTHEERVVAEFTGALNNMFDILTFGLPETLEDSPFTIPVGNTLQEQNLLIDRIYSIVAGEKAQQFGLFADLRDTMYRNLCQASNQVPYAPITKPLKHAMDIKAPLRELADTYLAGTPFLSYLNHPIPLKLTYQDRFSHTHIVGGSNSGKTQLLQSLILHDLQSEKPPSLVIVDSQGDLLSKISHLALFEPGGALADKLVIIDPKDVDYPPALNVFDVNQDRLRSYGAAKREQVVAGVIETFDYIFSGLLGADLTAKQDVLFKFIARLLLAIPETMGRNATILDMLEFMEDPGPYRETIATLPPIQRNFFARDFLNPKNTTFKQTREQVRYRLNAVLENPTMARLFTSPKTKIDLFEILNNGGIVLVDTSREFLKGASANFGRLFISLVLQAIHERAAIPEDERYPTFLVVDEAGSYFDTNIDDFLTDARKYKCGCVFAHQYLDQAEWKLRASFSANTSIIPTTRPPLAQSTSGMTATSSTRRYIRPAS